MTDGLGSKTYSYNQLSQMTGETRYFGSPLNQSFTLSYDYNLAGELKTITDPWAGVINYGFDATGRLNNMTGSGYGSVTQFASNLQYRAWNTLKSETYGNSFTESATYNNRMQMIGFDVRKPTSELQMSTTTQFYADGQVKFSHNALDERFDRAFAYDHVARATEAYSGSQARDFINSTNSGTSTGPYRQSYQYNSFNQISQQTNRLWSDNETTINTWANNRNSLSSYDAAGLAVGADGTSSTRDASGRRFAANDEVSHGAYSVDGDGPSITTVLTHPGFHGITVTTT